MKEMAYSFIPSNFRVVLNITLGVFAPYDWMVVFRLEKLINIFGPSLNSIELLFAEHVAKVL